jgi:signal transduction histidine kinase
MIKLRVLIVEDSEQDAALLIRELQKAGYTPVSRRVETAQEMTDALESQDWDIVLSDYVLPGFGGLIALKLLHSKGLDLPFIVVSGQIGEDVAVGAMKAGAHDYIMKGNLKRLGPTIERELKEARIRKERTHAEKQTRALSSRLLKVQEEERRTIAKELHDQIGQNLTGLKLMLSQVARSPQEKSETILVEAQSILSELIQQVRDISLKLRPSMLDDLGLLPTLLWHFERYTTQTGIIVRFEHKGLERNFHADINTAVFRIVQEALTNVARYAGVREVSVNVQADNVSIALSVKDQGQGFDIVNSQAGTSTGISGMRERAQLLGGKLEIQTGPGNGTLVTAEMPLVNS